MAARDDTSKPSNKTKKGIKAKRVINIERYVGFDMNLKKKEKHFEWGVDESEDDDDDYADHWHPTLEAKTAGQSEIHIKQWLEAMSVALNPDKKRAFLEWFDRECGEGRITLCWGTGPKGAEYREVWSETQKEFREAIDFLFGQFADAIQVAQAVKEEWGQVYLNLRLLLDAAFKRYEKHIDEQLMNVTEKTDILKFLETKLVMVKQETGGDTPSMMSPLYIIQGSVLPSFSTFRTILARLAHPISFEEFWARIERNRREGEGGKNLQEVINNELSRKREEEEGEGED
jgi:hypothetical protein